MGEKRCCLLLYLMKEKIFLEANYKYNGGRGIFHFLTVMSMLMMSLIYWLVYICIIIGDPIIKMWGFVIPLISLTPPHFCACPGTGFPTCVEVRSGCWFRYDWKNCFPSRFKFPLYNIS